MIFVPFAGFPPLPSSLYPSPYLPLAPLEASGGVGALHAQLGQHMLFESQKGEWSTGAHHEMSYSDFDLSFQPGWDWVGGAQLTPY